METGGVMSLALFGEIKMDVDFLEFQNLINNKTDDGVFAKFYDRVIKTDKILDNGLPEFLKKTYIEIRIRDNNDIVDQPAREEDKRRFPLEYQRYLLEQKQVEKGTPLNQFAFLDVTQLETCKFRGIFTVEVLAELDDDKAKSIGLEKEKELAQKFLDVSKNNQVINDFAKKEKKYQAEIKKLKEEISRLKEEK